MAVRFGNTLFLIPFFCLSLFIPKPVQASPLGTGLSPVTSAVATAVCIDPWHKPQPCRSPMSLLNTSAHQGHLANSWWLSLWSAAGEVAASPQLLLGGKRVSCGAAYDSASLVKFDFTHFQLNMDVDMDMEERLDTVRVAYRSCWR